MSSVSSIARAKSFGICLMMCMEYGLVEEGPKRSCSAAADFELICDDRELIGVDVMAGSFSLSLLPMAFSPEFFATNTKKWRRCRGVGRNGFSSTATILFALAAIFFGSCCCLRDAFRCRMATSTEPESDGVIVCVL